MHEQMDTAINPTTPKPTLFVAWSKRRWSPYRDLFDDGDVCVAVTLPGGFSGFGDTPDAAAHMAIARAFASKTVASKRGFAADAWLSSLTGRDSPNLRSLIDSLTDRSPLADGDDDVDIVLGRTYRDPRTIRNTLACSSPH